MGNLSLSISQQEVDATGNLKEYTPPPTFFSQKIPTEVLVYHIPEQGGDFSVAAHSLAAQSHHKMNLKRCDGRGNVTSQKWVCDCLTGDTTTSAQQKKITDAFDYDTIETEDDHTADYTLNTMGDSQLNYLRSMYEDLEDHRSHRNKSNNQREQVGKRMMRGEECDERRQTGWNSDMMVPTSTVSRCLLSCFGYGDDGQTSSHSRQRDAVVYQQQQQHRQLQRGAQDMHYHQQLGTELHQPQSHSDGGGDISLLRYRHRKSGCSQPQQQKQRQRYMSNNTRSVSGRDEYSTPHYNDNRCGLGDSNSEHELWEGDYNSTHHANNQGQGRGIPSSTEPPPNSDVDRADFGSMSRAGGKTGPQHHRYFNNDYTSVQSDLVGQQVQATACTGVPRDLAVEVTRQSKTSHSLDDRTPIMLLEMAETILAEASADANNNHLIADEEKTLSICKIEIGR